MAKRIWRLTLIVATLQIAACGQNDPSRVQNPIAPTLPAVQPTSSITVSGIVAEGARPITGARVSVMAVLRGSASWPAGQGTTDAAGRYRIALTDFRDSLAHRPTVWVVAGIDGYVQQCPVTAVLDSDTTLNVRLTSTANVSLARPTPAPNLRSVAGVVFELTPAGRRPVHGATVAWETGFDGFVAWTLTDAAGAYFLCDMPRADIDGLFATKAGMVAVAPRIAAGGDAVVDIEMR